MLLIKIGLPSQVSLVKKSLLAFAVASIALSGCALKPAQPYRFYSGDALPSEKLAVVQLKRTFGGPGVGVLRVDKKHVLDYESMAAYPSDPLMAARLEPQILVVKPGTHSFSVYFSYTDITNKVQMVTLLSLIGSSPVSMATFRKTAELEFDTVSNHKYFIRYSWNEKLGSDGVKFLVDECQDESGPCNLVATKISNEKAEILPGAIGAHHLLER